MKATIAMICAVTILSAGFIACNKEAKTQPSTQTAQAATVAHHSTAKGKGYTREAMILEGSGRVDCTQPGPNCKVSTKLTEDQMGEIATLTNIIAGNGNGNGNAYFNTPNWAVLFDEVNDTQGLLASLQSNQVFLYELPSETGSGTTYGYSYVISTAASLSSVNQNNIEWVWQY